MTEIKIEKKSAVWPWVLLGLGILALLIYLLFSYTHNESVETNFETNNTEGTKLINVRENNSTVAAFVSFVNNDTNKMSLDHSYTNAALLKLTQAIEAMAAETGYNVRADVDKAKEYANKITDDPSETTHADNIRKAADILSTSLQNMQQAKYPELATEAEELRRAAASIDPGVLTLDQKDAVRSFFGKAANLLQKMN